MANRQEYIKKMELKKPARQQAGLLSERFSKVSGIVINITYFHNAENPVLMERKINVFPSSYAYFNMECMIKGCDNGGFDLTSVIANQIKHHKTSVKGKMDCKGEHGDLTTDRASIAYEINVKYNKSSKKVSR
jgi:hypothetical protein